MSFTPKTSKIKRYTKLKTNKMRKRLFQIILIAILIVIIGIPFTNSVKSAGTYAD
ncbi:unnamed protein product, partial [marine sediment metagenome]